MNYERDLEAGLIVDAARRLLASLDPGAAAPARAMLARWEQMPEAHRTHQEAARELIARLDSGDYERAAQRHTEGEAAKAEALRITLAIREQRKERRARRRQIRTGLMQLLDSGEKFTQKELRARLACNGWELGRALKYYKRIRGIA